jgi:hypothetical protein
VTLIVSPAPSVIPRRVEVNIDSLIINDIFRMLTDGQKLNFVWKMSNIILSPAHPCTL